jgi:hypothetical protein
MLIPTDDDISQFVYLGTRNLVQELVAAFVPQLYVRKSRDHHGRTSRRIRSQTIDGLYLDYF